MIGNIWVIIVPMITTIVAIMNENKNLLWITPTTFYSISIFLLSMIFFIGEQRDSNFVNILYALMIESTVYGTLWFIVVVSLNIFF